MKECRGNMAQSCALNLLSSNSALSFINCLEMTQAPDLEINFVSIIIVSFIRLIH